MGLLEHLLKLSIKFNPGDTSERGVALKHLLVPGLLQALTLDLTSLCHVLSDFDLATVSAGLAGLDRFQHLCLGLQSMREDRRAGRGWLPLGLECPSSATCSTSACTWRSATTSESRGPVLAPSRHLWWRLEPESTATRFTGFTHKVGRAGQRREHLRKNCARVLMLATTSHDGGSLKNLETQARFDLAQATLRNL